jgi:RNA binding exosome subunit
VYGIDENGELYIHVKVYKQSRVFGEVVVTRGVVHLRCRECMRWQKVTIIQPKVARLEESASPIPPGTNN